MTKRYSNSKAQYSVGQIMKGSTEKQAQKESISIVPGFLAERGQNDFLPKFSSFYFGRISISNNQSNIRDPFCQDVKEQWRRR